MTTRPRTPATGRTAARPDPGARLGRFTADIGLPRRTVTGRAGARRITVRVDQPQERTLAFDSADPDGSPAVSRGSETTEAHVLQERRGHGPGARRPRSALGADPQGAPAAGAACPGW
ncbi:hypothetical protein PV703_31845 [Streptomyces sp. ME01-24h]|nr:hypothetical protein [Streptomyces sp. ME19-03-3]MDX3357806.1 hypothetical protein [Streptomyces sp. ME01-24h]